VLVAATAVVVLLAMSLCQLSLDRSRRVSLHCVVRNLLLFCGLAMWRAGMLSIWALVLALVGAEATIEVMHQLGWSLDPYINKVINYYRWADTMWSSSHVRRAADNFTEGKSDCHPHISIPDSQVSKFEWMADACGVQPGSRVVEVGCGNGAFMRYLTEKRGCTAVGLTPSPDQVALLTSSGLDARLVDIWDVGSVTELHGAFDAVVLNGSTEHFLNVANGQTPAEQAVLFGRMFRLIRLLIDPNSKSRRCVLTAIHMHRELSLYEMFQMYLLERSYGGYYAHEPTTYIDSAAREGFRTVKFENRTMDYYIWARKIWYHVYLGLAKDPKALLATVADVPVFALNDPYYLHKVLHLMFGTWSWQFSVPKNPLLAAGDTPPTLHVWMTLVLD
jgi:cyclopropane fatty-acyl-phospholipid synthase-like methyltransferase